MKRLVRWLVWFVPHRRTRYVASWLLALTTASITWYYSRHVYDNAEQNLNRADGNLGHTYIDFGGQWLMGRMLVRGHGPDLYNLRVAQAVAVGTVAYQVTTSAAASGPAASAPA